MVWSSLLLFALVAALGLNAVSSNFASLKTTEVSLWPKPVHLEMGDSMARLVPHSLRIVLRPPHALLERAILRYANQYFFPFPVDKRFVHLNSGILRLLEIRLTSIWMRPRLGNDDESYEINIYNPEGTEDFEATIQAESVVGALRALETFSQLIQPVGTEKKLVTSNSRRFRYYIANVPLTIYDHPSSAWRGLVIDTAQRFHPVEEIKGILDVMSWLKMNIFHWHLTNDEAFSFASHNLLARGSKSLLGTYHQRDIEEIIDYATERGIYVIPGIEMPAHTASWGKVDQKILVECSNHKTQLEVASEHTYVVLKQVLKDLDKLFPKGIPFHIGGRDMDLDCWGDKSVESNFWDTHPLPGKSTVKALGDYFFKQVYSTLSELQRDAIVWDDLMKNGLDIPSHMIIHSRGDKQIISNAVILSLTSEELSSWSHNNEQLESWRVYANVIGGEGVFWSEDADHEGRPLDFWPRVAQYAASLWETFPKRSIYLPDTDSWLCRAHQRGALRKQPVSSGNCATQSPDLIWSISFTSASLLNEVEFVMHEEDYQEYEYVPPVVQQPPHTNRLAEANERPSSAMGYLIVLALVNGGAMLGTALVRHLKGLPCIPFLVAGWVVLSLLALSRIILA